MGATWRGSNRIIVAAVAVTTAAAIASIGTMIAVLAANPVAPKIVPTPTMAPTPTPVAVAEGPLLSPFTGEPVKSLGGVLAVKIDNIVYARPQTGLSDADIVYVLPVEGGLTRFMAIFSSHFPPVIGPVRSARNDDLELLRQFGRPAFAYSGAQGQLLPVVERAHIVDLYAGRVVAPYYRDNSRIAPYNLYANTRQLLAHAKGASRAHSIGFRFGPAPAGGQVTRSYSVSYPSAKFIFTWSPGRGHWLVTMDGKPATTTDRGRLAPATVIMQRTTVHTSGYLEYGVPPPYAETVGHGTAVVLRGGKAYNVRWSRPSYYAGTTYTTMSGQRMNFAPGQVWILLVGNRKIEAG
jgi:Protein of unknown function (DUF3048) N-terminal domain/Protein of unknown function (DUF3048) C-terminal domain